MPDRQPLCPRCHDNMFVRAEQILSGRRILRAFYCGRCNHEWNVEGQPPPDTEEERHGERRRLQRRDSTVRRTEPDRRKRTPS